MTRSSPGRRQLKQEAGSRPRRPRHYWGWGGSLRTSCRYMRTSLTSLGCFRKGDIGIERLNLNSTGKVLSPFQR